MHSRRILGLLLISIALPILAQDSLQQAEHSVEAAVRARNFDQAVSLAQSAVQQFPKDAKLWTLKGIALSALNRKQEALTAYDRALNVSPDYLPALEGAAELEYNSGGKRAAALLERIVKLQPENSTAHAMLAVTEYHHHDCASAVKHFDASRQVIASQPAALAAYGSCLFELDQPENAVPVFREMLSSQPLDPHARYNLAVVQLAANHSQDALSTLQPLLGDSQPDPDVLDLAATAYEESGDTPNAVKLLRQAIILDPKRIKSYVDFATISFTHQSFQVGVDMINVGLQANPKAAQLYVARGVLYIQLGQYDKGESDFATANKLDPRQSSGAIAEGLAQMQQSNLEQALTTVHAQLKAHPQDFFLHYMEGQILFQQGAEPNTPEFKQAIAATERSAQLNPEFELAHDLLGNLYLKSGQIDRSIEQSRLALKQNPSDQESLYHLIQALRQDKRDTKGELPALVKRLAELRKEARSAEAAGNRYKLYEPEPSTEGPK